MKTQRREMGENMMVEDAFDPLNERKRCKARQRDQGGALCPELYVVFCQDERESGLFTCE